MRTLVSHTRCYLVDIDGTLAHGGHRLHHIEKEPKDWEAYFAACDGDAPIPHIIELVQSLANRAKIVLVSGRSAVCEHATKRWLFQHEVPYDALYMRQEGDHQDDDKLKIEMLAQVRADGYEPIMCFDDRDRVVAAWRAAGIPCAQVAPGAF